MAGGRPRRDRDAELRAAEAVRAAGVPKLIEGVGRVERRALVHLLVNGHEGVEGILDLDTEVSE